MARRKTDNYDGVALKTDNDTDTITQIQSHRYNYTIKYAADNKH